MKLNMETLYCYKKLTHSNKASQQIIITNGWHKAFSISPPPMMMMK